MVFGLVLAYIIDIRPATWREEDLEYLKSGATEEERGGTRDSKAQVANFMFAPQVFALAGNPRGFRWARHL